MVKGQTKMFLLKTGQMTKSSLAQSMLYEHFTSSAYAHVTIKIMKIIPVRTVRSLRKESVAV